MQRILIIVTSFALMPLIAVGKGVRRAVRRARPLHQWVVVSATVRRVYTAKDSERYALWVTGALMVVYLIVNHPS